MKNIVQTNFLEEKSQKVKFQLFLCEHFQYFFFYKDKNTINPQKRLYKSLLI